MKRILLAGVLILATASFSQAAEFIVTSPQFVDGGRLGQEQVFNGFGCMGQNISPQLEWQGEPVGTKSFAVTVYDPDAPTGSGWWHWVVFDIPADTHNLPADGGKVPEQTVPGNYIQSRTDFGMAGYGGACPPTGHGDHRYQFTVWALDTPHLGADEQASGAMVGFFLNQHKLAKAVITAKYGR